MSKRLLIALVLILSACAPTQTLARPGWAGSGLNIEPWWTHAVLYSIDPHRFSAEGLRGAAKQLDYIRALGIDGIVLTHVQPAPEALSVDPAIGTIEDLDDFVREASRSSLRVVFELDANAPDLEKRSRFWLGHGVAGLSLNAPNAAQLSSLRAITKTVTGQRILIAETPAEAALTTAGVELTVAALAPKLEAATLRPILQRLSAAQGNKAVSIAFDGNAEAANLLGTLLLATHANAELQAGQELGTTAVAPKDIAAQDADPASTLNVYRRLTDLHHGNGVIRSGSVDFLDHDAQNALVWVMRKPQITPTAPALVLACNLSAQAVTLSLTDDLRALHLRGTFLRTLLRTDKGLGGVSLNAVTLPPYAVYIGELRF